MSAYGDIMNFSVTVFLGIVLVVMNVRVVFAQSFSPATQRMLKYLELRGVKLPPGSVITSQDLRDLGITEGGKDPYQVITEHFPDGIYSEKDKKGRIAGLNPQFARCMSRMIAAAEKDGVKIVIRDAKRSDAQQKSAQNSAAIAASGKNSPHLYGLGVDIDAGTIPLGKNVLSKQEGEKTWKWVKQNASTYGLGYIQSETGHIEARKARCGISAYEGKTKHLMEAAQKAKVKINSI